ncbi:hypothetical protein C8R45DRAFT_1220394 [Mycena sanguinolenta]|nr:hypothetical protein C8R45DRAFT_1220394 [Mycena sanguinolenta]
MTGLPVELLMLVSKHVKEWLEPFFIAQFTADFSLVPYDIVSAVIRRKPPAFFHNAELQSILSVCTGMEDLWIDDMDNALIPLIQSLPLKRLYMGFGFLPSPTLPMFRV